jgi:hypothetical protein
MTNKSDSAVSIEKSMATATTNTVFERIRPAPNHIGHAIASRLRAVEKAVSSSSSKTKNLVSYL